MLVFLCFTKNMIEAFIYGWTWDTSGSSSINQNFTNMVTIVDFRLNKNSDGEEFVSILIEGDLIIVQSTETGNFYAAAKRS